MTYQWREAEEGLEEKDPLDQRFGPDGGGALEDARFDIRDRVFLSAEQNLEAACLLADSCDASPTAGSRMTASKPANTTRKNAFCDESSQTSGAV